MLLSKVSILIPCYNAERWIAQAIQSALDQTYPNKEVIVVDDGSTDRSLEIIKRFGDRIHWETQPNQGGNITRNRLLELSSGEWLQYLDADDYLQPDKVEKQVQFLQQHPQADIIYSPIICEYDNGDSSRQELLPIPEPHDPWILLARWFLPQTGCPLWRKQAILEIGGWKVDQPCCQEHELYLRLLMANKRFEYCPESGSVYRQWSESTVCKRDKSLTYRQRLAIKNQLEEHLRGTHQLTQERLHAINQARFECARIIWLTNKQWAIEIIKQIRKADRYFLPSGDCAPEIYRLMYQFLGFHAAETLAAFKRVQMIR
jgi:glycosyltransferase involved in cell wall biosynthesis